MAPTTGTYTLADLLAVRFQSVNEFGINTVVQALEQDRAAHNQIVTDMLSDLVMKTTDTQGVYGTGSGGEMIEVDEYGRSQTQKSQPGSTVAFPLRKFQYAAGWTLDYLEEATPADLAQRQLDAEKAHVKAVRRDLKRAIYGASNYTWNDFLVNNVALGVKRFVNADSAAIPDAPDGGTFTASSHTHYDGASSLTAAVATAAITDLIEHGHGGRVKIAINYADATAFSALTGFVPAIATYIDIPTTSVSVPVGRTNLADQYNRLLGYFGAAEVWVKPWAIANYLFVWDAASSNKPLGFREPVNPSKRGLYLAATLNTYPFNADYYEAKYGVGVFTRTNGVVVYFANSTYASPTIT